MSSRAHVLQARRAAIVAVAMLVLTIVAGTPSAAWAATSAQLQAATYLGGAAADTLTSAAIAPDGSLLVAGSIDPAALPAPTTPLVRLPNVVGPGVVLRLSDTGTALRSGTVIGALPRDLVAMDDGGVVVGTSAGAYALGADGRLRWRADIGAVAAVANLGGGSLAAVARTDAESRVVLLGTDGGVEASWPAPAGVTLTDVAVSPDGDRIAATGSAAAGLFGTHAWLRVYDRATGARSWGAWDAGVAPQRAITPAATRGMRVAYAPDGSLVLLAQSTGAASHLYEDPRQHGLRLRMDVMRASDPWSQTWGVAPTMHVSWLGRFTAEGGGALQQARFVVARGAANQAGAVQLESLAVDERGAVHVGGAAACCLPGRDRQDGIARPGASGPSEAVAASFSPALARLDTALTHTAEPGSGTIAAVAVHDDQLLVAGARRSGNLITWRALDQTPAAVDGYAATWVLDRSVEPVATPSPAVRITSPAARNVVSGNVSVGCSPALPAGTTLELLVDGARTAEKTLGSDGCSVPWDTTSLPDGEHALRVRTRDAGGPGRLSLPVDVELLNTPRAGLAVTYFDDEHLAAPVAGRQTTSIAGSWGVGAPFATMGSDTFSMRWQGHLRVPSSGSWTLHPTADDGIRIWVDGNLVVDAWDMARPPQQPALELDAGRAHELRVEYRELSGDASVGLRWSGPGTAPQAIPATALSTPRASGIRTGVGIDQGLHVEYFPSDTLTGSPVRRVVPSIDMRWGRGAPAPSLPADRFSARWSGLLRAPSTDTFLLRSSSDDGARVWVDGRLVIDSWSRTGPRTVTAPVRMEAGHAYELRVEYRDVTGDAYAQLAWSSSSFTMRPVPVGALTPRVLRGTRLPNPATRGLTATYYRDTTMTSVVATRVDPVVDFTWATRAPFVGVPRDGFSVRWTGRVRIDRTGYWAFCPTTDDGVRMWLDGTPLLSAWVDQAATQRCARRRILGGRTITIRMDYYDRVGDATARLLWTGPGVPLQSVATANLLPR